MRGRWWWMQDWRRDQRVQGWRRSHPRTRTQTVSTPDYIFPFVVRIMRNQTTPHQKSNCFHTCASKLLRINSLHISHVQGALALFCGKFFFSILDINWFARILDWTTSTLLSANFDVKDPFENLKIESPELFLKILRVASYCWKSLWKLVCHAY